MVPEPQPLCHEMLLRLAGRLPDEQLWRFRDWLASGATDVLGRALPRALVRERVGLTAAEHDLLAEALPASADPAVISTVRGVEDPAPGGYAFAVDPPAGARGDSDVLVLGATLRGRPGLGEVRSTWRHGPGVNANPQRVMLLTASGDHADLTGEVQRILRALGDRTPCVEVIPADLEPPAYHHAALARSAHVCAGSAAPGTGTPGGDPTAGRASSGQAAAGHAPAPQAETRASGAPAAGPRDVSSREPGVRDTAGQHAHA